MKTILLKDAAALIPDLMGSLIERHDRLLRRLHNERVTLLFPYPSSY